MKLLRSIRIRLAVAVVAAASASLVSVGAASADPSDPVCIMPPEDYCTLYAGYVFGSIAYRQCYRTAFDLQNGEYCNPVGFAAVAGKPD